MKFNLVIRQAAVVRAGFIGKVTLPGLCLLDYLRGWEKCDKAQYVVSQDKRYYWIHYPHAISELPIVFNPTAKPRTRKNEISRLMLKLRASGLIDTVRVRHRLFFRLTEAGLKLGATDQAAGADSVTHTRAESVTTRRTDCVTSRCDDPATPNINETGTMETETKETPPLSPSEGEMENIVVCWNSLSQLPPVKTLTRNRARKLRKLLADPFWREHWREGIRRVASSAFLTGGGPNSWRAGLDWFLQADSLTKVLEGTYDDRPGGLRKESVASWVYQRKVRLQALEELIEEHAGNPNANYSSPPTQAEREKFQTIVKEAEKLRRELALGPKS